MNWKVLLGCSLLMMGTANPASAHPGHKHEKPRPEIDEQAATARAKEEVGRLIEKKKIDASWSDAGLKSIEKKPFKKSWEWLAIFENQAAPKDKLLYVFLKPSGEFVAANFTGK